jgi:DNA-binding NtrC family response regulator
MTTAQIKQLASQKNILITGEPGVGKRHTAQQIFQARNKKSTFIRLDGLSSSHEDVETALFDKKQRPAAIEKDSTLLIANVDAFDPLIFEKIGSFVSTTRESDKSFQVILTASSKTELNEPFLPVKRVEIQPLRNRRSEFPDLVRSILNANKREDLQVNPSTLLVLQESVWPDNIKELLHVIGRAILFSKGKELELPSEVLNEQQQLKVALECIESRRAFEIDKTLWLLEKLFIERLLAVHQYNQTNVAAAVGLSEANFRYRLRKFGIPAIREKRQSER